MRIQNAIGALLMILAMSPDLKAADPSFSGTWKVNMAKSKLAGQIITFTKAANGRVRYDSQGYAYDFTEDGKEHPTPDGGSTAWRHTNARTWDVTNRLSRKRIATWRVTLDGDKLTIDMKTMTEPVAEQVMVMTRVSGGPGLVGRWRGDAVTGTALSLVISTDDRNGITMTIPEVQIACTAKFDGKAYPVTGAGAQLKQTFAFTRTGPNAFKYLTKLRGKDSYVDIMTMSEDGKSMTDDGTPTNSDEPAMWFFERQ